MSNKPLTAHLISQQTFENWSYAWQQLEFNSKPFDFFKEGDELIVSMLFDSKSMSSLLSTTGVSTIKIRFGLNIEKNDFEIILFGTDTTGQILTPYYIPFRKNFQKTSPPIEQGDGKVPIELIRQWKNNWLVTAGKGAVTNNNFLTPYGFTRGYNYALKEFIETLFTFDKAPNINIVFVLHEYYGVNYLTTQQVTSTFGVVLQAQKSEKDIGLSADDESYYDLTAPCPRTC